MAITKQKKGEILERVSGILKDAKSVTFANFHGLTVSEVTELRNTLRKEGVGYYVAKKTLIKKALNDAKFQGEIPSLDGEVAVSWSEDEVASAREIFNFEKKFEKRVSILGGIFEGAYRNKEGMTEIALIPSMQTLRAQFVNVINSPIQGLAVALSKIAEKKG